MERSGTERGKATTPTCGVSIRRQEKCWNVSTCPLEQESRGWSLMVATSSSAAAERVAWLEQYAVRDVELSSEEQYRPLQRLRDSNAKTASGLKLPSDTRSNYNASFCRWQHWSDW